MFILCLSASVQAQTWTIEGVVQQAVTGKNLAEVNVYINGSTIGTKTDSSGRFKLTSLKVPRGELIASMVGFQTYSVAFTFKDNKPLAFTILLNPDDKLLQEFTVKAGKDKAWEKMMRRFEEELVGNNPFAKQTTLKNRWVVDFSKDDTTDELSATASQPLEIENRALGYRVFFDMRKFRLQASDFFFSGYSRFEEIQPKDTKELKKWHENRKIAFQASEIYFLKSLIQHKLKENGFMVFTVNKNYTGKTQLSSLSSQFGNRLLPFSDSLAVEKLPNSTHYWLTIPAELEILNTNVTSYQQTYQDAPFPVSWLLAKRLRVECTAEGLALQPGQLVWAGDIANKRMAHQLPLDYQPPLELDPLAAKQRIDSLSRLNSKQQKEAQQTPITTLKTAMQGDSLRIVIEVKNANKEPLGGQCNVVITETTQTTDLDTVGYITQAITKPQVASPTAGKEAKKKGLLNAKPDFTVPTQVIRESNATDILTVLQAKIPGVVVTQVIEDGVSRNVLYLRASQQNKLSIGNYQPLVMINGIPFTSSVLDLQAIPVSSVQSIEVYKRANPILGIRSYNGILNIVTQGTSKGADTASETFYFQTVTLSDTGTTATFWRPTPQKRYTILVTGLTTSNEPFTLERSILVR